MSNYASELSELMPERSTAPHPGVGINVSRLVKLRGHMMGILFVAIVVPAIAAIWLLVPREYDASVDFEFKAAPQTIFGGDTRPVYGPSYDNYVNTQVKLMTSPTILREVANDPDIKGLPAVKGSDDPILYLMSNLDAAGQPRTELVTLHYRHPDRDTAMLVLNTIIKKYTEYVFQGELNRGGLRRRTLLDTKRELVESLDQQREEISRQRRELEVPIGNRPGLEPTETEAFRVNLAQAIADDTSAQSRLRQTQKMLDRIEDFSAQLRSNPNRPIYALAIESEVAQHPNVSLLNEQLALVQQEHTVLKETYLEGAPQLEIKRAELEALQGEFAGAENRVRKEVLGSLQAQYEYDLSVNEADIEDAVERRNRFIGLLEDYRQESLELSHGIAEVEEMERRYDDTREYLRELKNQLLTLEIESNAPARVNVLGEANAPVSPDDSRRLKFILMALLGAMSLAAAVGVAREFLDQSIRSAQDLGYITEVPVLSSVPHTSEDRLPEGVKPATLAEDYPASATADEIRRTMARVLMAAGGREAIKTCMVASPVRGDGKTTLACNLAIVLAQAGRRVLLIDINANHPGVEGQLGLMPGPGLAEILAGEAVEHDPDRNTGHKNLFVMGPGVRSHELTEGLASKAMSDFLGGAQEVFDHVIIDAPATLLTAEAKLLAPRVDGIVLVVGAGVSSFGMVRRSLAALREIGGNVVGIVLNGVRQTPGGYLRPNIEMYYSEEPQTANAGIGGFFRRR